ncbi:PAS domain S-box protein [Eubacteriales bacterium OttesenSCG-928-K08]|nr:PAS domain S-box protein [Eubacteriales bacterium OttesenSCG-928-K08]
MPDFKLQSIIKSIKTSGIEQMIAVDYAGIATIKPDTLAVSISGGATFGEQIPQEAIFNQLTHYAKQIVQQEKGGHYTGPFERGQLDLMVVAIPCGNLYFIVCKMDGEFTGRDIKTAEYISDNMYERLALNHALAREKNYYQSIHESNPTQIMTMNTKGEIVYINSAFERLIGNREQHIGKTMRSFLAQEDHYDVIMAYYREALEKRKPVECIVKFPCIDGNMIIDEVIIAPLIRENGRMIGMVLYGTDITEKRIYEKEIEQLRQHALLGEVSAYIAHDIQNPLSGIRSISQAMQNSPCSEEDRQDFLRAIVTSVDRISKTIRQLLSYARLSSDDKTSIVNINEILDNCIDAVSFHQQFREIQIHKHYDPLIPIIKARQIRLEQAFMNILLNAIQAIEEKGNITIASKYHPEQNQITIHFTDNGIGLAKAELERVKEPFYTTKPDGTGLGLEIVHRAVQEHGGKLEIDSTLGFGTTVKVTLFC